MKDYYDILGVDKGVNGDEIKRAFRRLAKKYHPDKNPGNADAEKRFKEINESYEVLGNPDKRQKYDRMRSMGGRGFQGFNPFENFGGQRDPSSFDFGDLFSSVFSGNPFGGAASGPKTAAPKKGEDVYIKLDVPFEVAAKGGKSNIRLNKTHVCSTCRGNGAAPGTQKNICGQCSGTGKMQSRQGTFAVNRTCPRCLGSGAIITTPCSSCAGSGVVKKPRTLSVNIPTGVNHGQKIKLSGEGSPGQDRGPAGDLYIEICVKKHPVFQRDNHDVISEHSIDLKEVLLGASISVKTLHSEVEMKIPAGIQPGASLRITGHGIRLGKHHGDHLAKIKVRLPKKLTPRQKELLEEFVALGLE